jgi:RNA polymerase sigma-70 factor, ECF subfamily
MENPELLLQRAGDGDTVAAAELLDGFRDRLRRAIDLRIDRRVIARIDASDVVQEAMTNACNRLQQYLADPQMPLYIWLRRIAIDRLMDMYRVHFEAQKRSVLREQSEPLVLNNESVAELANSIVASSLNPSRRAIAAETQAQVRAGLMKLKPADREVLVLRYLEQLEVEDIALVLGISKTAVTSRHLRAIQRLRQLLENESGE